jgi:hypothetical protein
MKNIIIIILLCAIHFTTKANGTILYNKILQDSICVCKKNKDLTCCKQPTTKYYGNPSTLSPKEKMKYETMNAGTCCDHKNKKRKNNCKNCIKEPANKK